MLASPFVPRAVPALGLFDSTMDVNCERCATEYELDDALVSERGTTVKCTSCGHQFKVFREGEGDGMPERWVVRQTNGRELVFLTLRELQRAIEQGRVVRADLLSRGAHPPRPLGSISELEPFFADAKRPLPEIPKATPSSKTLTGMPQIAREPAPSPSRPADEPLPPPPPSPSSVAEPPSYDMTPSFSQASYGADPESYAGYHEELRTRSRRLRLLVSTIVLGMLGVAAFTVGRPYIEEALSLAGARTSDDARLVEFLTEGERALSRGDVEGAKEAFDKASVLAEKHPQLLADLARLASVRADWAWLKPRLLPPEPPDAINAAKRALDAAAERAHFAVEQLAEIAPDAPTTLRAKIDVLRMAGDLASARALVAKVGSISSQPETGYVLSMLDLAEEAPSWPTVIDRLRTAVAAEQDLSRARAVLVYALVRSGDFTSAKSELAKILAAPHPHPLAAELQAFLSRESGETKPAPSPPASTEEAPKPPTEAATPSATSEPQPPAPPASPPAALAIPSDHHELHKQAARAKSAGQLDRAEQLYQAAIARNPGDTEALSGLGDIARARGNTTAARRYYEQAHEQNPSYLPAIAALADMRWASGDRAGALPLYRQIVDTAPGTTLAARARERLAQGRDEKGAKAESAAGAEGATRAETEAPAKQELPPEIDTSDLPGFQR